MNSKTKLCIDTIYNTLTTLHNRINKLDNENKIKPILRNIQTILINLTIAIEDE